MVQVAKNLLHIVGRVISVPGEAEEAEAPADTILGT
jgi:hypothetical protein